MPAYRVHVVTLERVDPTTPLPGSAHFKVCHAWPLGGFAEAARAWDPEMVHAAGDRPNRLFIKNKRVGKTNRVKERKFPDPAAPCQVVIMARCDGCDSTPRALADQVN